MKTLTSELKTMIDLNGTDRFFESLAAALLLMAKSRPADASARRLLGCAANVALTTRDILRRGER